MINRIVQGGHTSGLLLYLTGPGRANEHERPHVVAGSQIITDKWGEWEQLSQAQSYEIAKSIDRYMTAFNVHPMGRVRMVDPDTGETIYKDAQPNHVWHCALSLPTDDGTLSDEKWQAIVTDFMSEMGFTGSDGKAECRWVAIRHGLTKNGGDHVHIVANTVRADGTKWSNYRDQVRAAKACNMLEHKYGLTVIESREHARGARADSAQALNEAARKGEPLTDRAKLETRVRTAAMSARSEAEFVTRVRALGVRIRPRYAKGRNDVVTGYSVALHTRKGEKTRWYGASSLARDLALPHLRQRWPDTVHGSAQAVAAWKAAAKGMPAPQSSAHFSPHAWEAHIVVLEVYKHQLGIINPHNPAELAAATQDISSMLSAQALKAQHPEAAYVYDKAARALARHAQTHRPISQHLPNATSVRMMTSLASLIGAPNTAQSMLLVRETMDLIVELAQLYEQAGQTRTAQWILADTVHTFNHIHQSPQLISQWSRANARYEQLRVQAGVLAAQTMPDDNTPEQWEMAHKARAQVMALTRPGTAPYQPTTGASGTATATATRTTTQAPARGSSEPSQAASAPRQTQGASTRSVGPSRAREGTRPPMPPHMPPPGPPHQRGPRL